MLQFGDGIRCPHVIFTTYPERIVSAHIQRVGVDGVMAVGVLVPAHGLCSDFLDAHALDHACSAGKVFFDEIGLEANRVENLRAAVRLVSGYPHLGKNFKQAFANGLDVALVDLFFVKVIRQVSLHGRQCFKRQPGIDCFRTIAGEHRELVYFAG